MKKKSINLKKTPSISNPKPFIKKNSILDDEELEKRQEAKELKNLQRREYPTLSW